MSDPAKTPEEIEDVLASVRRLVSDHAPSRDDALQAAVPAPIAAPTPVAVQTEALVLTPSFRVTDPEDPWVPVLTSEEPDAPVEVHEDTTAEDLIADIVTADAAPDPAPIASAASADDADWQPDDRLASFDAVGEADDAPMPQEWVDDHSDEASDDDIADLIRLDGSDATVADFESETGDDNWPESGAEAALLTLVARRDPAPEMAEAPKVVPVVDDVTDVAPSDVDEAPEAKNSEDPDVLTLAREMEEGHAEEEASSEDSTVDAETSEDDEVPADPSPQDDADAEIAESLADTLPDVTPIFARAAGSDAAEHVVDVPAEDEPSAEDAHADDAPAEDLGDTPSPFTFPESGEGILDEDTLREIIVDVVREELQGVLGQRITRNVRKMVRREIRLALAAEDLE